VTATVRGKTNEKPTARDVWMWFAKNGTLAFSGPPIVEISDLLSIPSDGLDARKYTMASV
jgi:hypothetical protein